MKRIIRSFIYEPRVNQVIRSVSKLFRSFIPDSLRINPSGLVRIRVTEQISVKLKTNQTSHITRLLFWNDPLNFEYTSIFISLIKEMNSFWDIGSNIGYYAILGSTLNENLEVHAFEPSMGPSIYLSENVKLNELTSRINVHNLAISNKSGDIDFYQIFNPKFPTILNLSGEHNIGSKKGLNSRQIKVPAKSIDEIRRKTGPIDLIKIDVEGAEALVFEGGYESIQKDRPIIICEILPGSRQVNEIDDSLRKLDYDFFAFYQKELHEVQSLKDLSIKQARDFFLVPKLKRQIIERYIAQN